MSLSDETTRAGLNEHFEDPFSGALLDDKRARGAAFLLAVSAGKVVGAEPGSEFHEIWGDISSLVWQSGAEGSEVLRRISQTLEKQGVITIAEVIGFLPFTSESVDLMTNTFSPYQYTNNST